MENKSGDNDILAVKRGPDGQRVQKTQRGQDGEAIARISYPEPEAPVANKTVVRRKVGEKKRKSKKQSKTEKQSLKRIHSQV